MLIRPKYGCLPVGGLLLIAVLVAVIYSGPKLITRPSEYVRQWWRDSGASSLGRTDKTVQEIIGDEHEDPVDPDKFVPTEEVAQTHIELFSNSREDGSFFDIKFGDYGTINPNIIPHPTNQDTYIIVAQEFERGEHQATTFNMELVCEASFKKNGTLSCIKPPLLLPIAATSSPLCAGDLGVFNFNIGPHDARVFFGPESPFIIFGSQSMHNCFGQWMQDFRILVDWGHRRQLDHIFQLATDLQRPPPYSPIEKNWFVFWDALGDMYAHYDIAPSRSFARLAPDGSVGVDLASLTKYHDNVCLQKYLPPIPPQSSQSIHQATNSLAITLCKRKDVACKRTPANTYILTIVQHKREHNVHSIYEPYVVLFKETAPFELHGISTKPLWIHGRRPVDPEVGDDPEMFYITSVSWKAHDLKYHGFLDDVLFLNFGIEDARTGGIDIVASDLLKELGVCDEAQFSPPSIF